MFSEEHTAEIEDWYEGALTGEALAAFEKKLREDPSWAAEVSLQGALRRAVREKAPSDFRLQVETLLARQFPPGEAPPTGKSVPIFRILLSAAAAISLILAAVWIFRYPQPALSDQYAEAFNPPASFYSQAIRSKNLQAGQSKMDSVWTELDQAWTEKRPEEALRTALEIANTDSSFQRRQEAYFAAGVIVLSNSQPQQAIGFFQKARPNNMLAEELVWYTALAYVQMHLADPQNPEWKRLAVEALKTVLNGRQPAMRIKQARKMLATIDY